MSLLSICSRHFSTAAGRSPVGMLIGGDSCAEFLHEMFVEGQVKSLQKAGKARGTVTQEAFVGSGSRYSSFEKIYLRTDSSDRVPFPSFISSLSSVDMSDIIPICLALPRRISFAQAEGPPLITYFMASRPGCKREKTKRPIAGKCVIKRVKSGAVPNFNTRK